MQLIYCAHSYRKEDDDINEFFQKLMHDEQLVPSLDPKSNRLNAAKPERHLRCTDGVIAVLTRRDPEPSPYIRWEISRALRARMPQLVFVEDVLADDLVSPGTFQRRFSRKRFLREARDHRHAIQLLKSYIGGEPPPNFQATTTRRQCVVIGGRGLTEAARNAVHALLNTLDYAPLTIASNTNIPASTDEEQAVQRAALCIAFIEDLTPTEYYLLGMAQSMLTPSILLTQRMIVPAKDGTPPAYGPRYVDPGNIDDLVATIRTEIDIFEEDYLELIEEKQIRRYHEYKERLLTAAGGSHSGRQKIINFITNSEVDMSNRNYNVHGNTGQIIVDSRMEKTLNIIRQNNSWSGDDRDTLSALITELEKALEPVAEKNPDGADRVKKSTEVVVTEAARAQPDKNFLALSVEGLKQAAQAVAAIAPAVLTAATKVVEFFTKPQG